VTQPVFAARLEVEGLSVARGGALIVRAAAFSVNSGGGAILRGVNGAGKTSLLRAIAGLLPIASGSVSVICQGKVYRDAADRRMSAVYCGHGDGVKSAMTGIEHLRFWRALYGAPRQRIDGAIGAFDLAAFLERPALHLSAGERRRLGLSRLLIAEKPLWLLDEPTAAIDAASADRLSTLIASHRARGGIVLVATHDKFELPNAARLLIAPAERRS